MERELDPATSRFREQVGAWLDHNAPSLPLPPPTTTEGMARHLAWERRLHDAGYAAPGWPREFGGLGMDLWGETVFDEEYVGRGLPERLNKMALMHGARTVMAHGTPEQKAQWLPSVLDCGHIWCQGFSEPEAGSDLAAVRTTARVDGDELVLDGQKTWTSQGAIATRMYALVRTDPAAPKRHGLSFVVFDLDVPGVEVRPMIQLHGHSGFAEVYFSGARIPRSSVVGDLDDGWRIAQTALQMERGSARGVHVKLTAGLNRLAADVERLGVRDRAVLERLGSLRAWVFACVQSTYSLVDRASRGTDDAVAASINKLRLSELETAVHEMHMEVLGAEGEVVAGIGPAGELPGLHREYWHARAAEIFAGTSEIQKNIIAERGLGLPREAAP